MLENKVGTSCWSFPDDITIENNDNPSVHSYILDRAYPPGTNQVNLFNLNIYIIINKL